MGEHGCRPGYCVCGIVLPQRVVVCILCACAIFVGCGQRQRRNLAIAVRRVSRERDNASRHRELSAISRFPHGMLTFNASEYDADDDYTGAKIDFSDIRTNMLMAAFPVGHFFGQIPFGVVADEIGGRWILLVGLSISTFLCFLLPTIIVGLNLLLALLARMMLGLSQSVMYPCISVLLAHWIPFGERGQLAGFTFSMYPFADMVSDVVGELARGRDQSRWKYGFYIWGVIGVIWCVAFYFFVYNMPQKHPRITPKEKEFLISVLPPFGKTRTATCERILSHRGIWALMIGQIGHNFTFLIMMVDIPYNLYKSLGVPKGRVDSAGLVPFLGFIIISVVSGVIIDYGISKKNWNCKWTRRIATFLSFAIPNTFLCISYYVRHSKIALLSCYSIAILLSGSYSASFRVNHFDITVNTAGIVMGIINFGGDILAVIILFIVRTTAPSEHLHSWEINVWVAFVLSAITATYYLLQAEVERAPWDIPPEEQRH